MTAPLLGAFSHDDFSQAIDILANSVESGQVKCAAIAVLKGNDTDDRFEIYQRVVGEPQSIDSMFLLGSISKPICVTALMTLFDRREFKLDDPIQHFVAQFKGDGREAVTMRHLLTHVSGLPDQVAANDRLRKSHATLDQFIDHAIRTPLEFAPGSQYQYSSMGILLATHIAEIITQKDIKEFVAETVFQPLQMKHSAQGMGTFSQDDIVPVQTEFAAPEAGAGDPNAKDWDWNSSYWRELGAPWGGTQASVLDVGRFMQEFLLEQENVLKRETKKMMVSNQAPRRLTPRGLGFNVGATAASPGCSMQSFGHTGSTGTIAWADPTTRTVCIVLTSLPGRAITPHPRELAAVVISKATKGG